MKNLFIQTLNQMPLMFTSNEFSNKARENGIPDKWVKQGKCGDFLHKHCDQYLTNKTWQKRIKNTQIIKVKENVYTPPIIIKDEQINTDTFTEENCIKFLKEKGYKIFKYSEI